MARHRLRGTSGGILMANRTQTHVSHGLVAFTFALVLGGCALPKFNEVDDLGNRGGKGGRAATGNGGNGTAAGNGSTSRGGNASSVSLGGSVGTIVNGGNASLAGSDAVGAGGQTLMSVGGTSNGGMTTSTSGGTTTASGGVTNTIGGGGAAAAGVPTSAGGVTARGGAATAGGVPTNAGGVTAGGGPASGGAPPITGGATARGGAATGGAVPTTGGVTATGGAATGGAAPTTGGVTATGGAATGGAATGGSTGLSVPPLTVGTNGTTTRYWDCCKPSCSWAANATASGMSSPATACAKDGSTVLGASSANACEGGPSYQCNWGAPWQVGPNLSFGFAAYNGTNCGKCYQLDFANTSTLAGKSMIVQAINVGAIAANQFDLLIPGGGVGSMNACVGASGQWGAVPAGATFGGFLSTCGTDTSCVTSMCQAAFGSNSALMASCNWFVGWFGAANNPPMKYAQVTCPIELTNRSGLK